MTEGFGSKITAEHLRHKAYIYVRQSTVRQVFENTESTARQYALGQRALALGWPADQVVVIDSDLGQSGAAAQDREGFQRLVTEVSMGRVGIVMGLEVSRLARNSSDWHRLLEICALSKTLILDQDGLYDPTDFNDRLVLGLKGTMSEAELHVMRARLQGGLLNKAQRGELRQRLPVGLLYDEQGRVILDPDEQVQQSIRLLFATFQRTGAACATVRAFDEQSLQFPLRLNCGPRKGELHWKPLTDTRALDVLHNPRYAGAYAYGRRQQRRNGMDRKYTMVHVPREQWQVLITGAHEGYITWEEYGENQRQMTRNDRCPPASRIYPPREGPALLQGLAVCGICGANMTVRYCVHRGRPHPYYLCKGAGNTQSRPICQSIPGSGIDAAIGKLLYEVVTPVALEVALAVQEELQARIAEVDRLRLKQVERHQYEVDLARQRYMKTDPNNRLVADTLEGDWNEKLRLLTASREEYERRRKEDRLTFDATKQARVRALATDFPRLWHDAKTPDRERKRMARLIIKDVTLIKGAAIAVHVRFKGGATRSLNLPRPPMSWERRTVSAEVVKEIDRQLDHHTYLEVAAILNGKKMVSGSGRPFNGQRVKRVARARGLTSRRRRLRAAGLLTLRELAAKLDVCTSTVKFRRAKGRLGVRAYRIDDVGCYMYDNPDNVLSEGARVTENTPVNSGRGAVV